MKRGLLHISKDFLPILLTHLPEKNFTFLSEKIKSAQASAEEKVSVEVSSEELEALLDRLPPSDLRNQILQTYQSF